ncbi:hypothetical protein [Shimazuella kribbensis]|uniref:hypothetical protein n=1 Tax=Shimazuella kribbensis TaxID=139808 RepID=UPI00040D96FD|nr:hypothetical protein [Shimazuella kribbensis]
MSAKDEKEAWENEAKEAADDLRHLLANYPLPDTPEGRTTHEYAEDALREHTALNLAEAAEKGAQGLN